MRKKTRIRTYKKIKSEAQSFLFNLILDMNTTSNIFLNQLLQKENLFFNDYLNSMKVNNLMALAEISNSRNLVGTFDSVEVLRKDLNA